MSFKKVSLTLVLLAVVSAATYHMTVSGQVPVTKTAVTQWEYKVVTNYQLVDKDKISGLHVDVTAAMTVALNNLGKEGWEIVAATQQHTGLPNVVFYLKRPLQ